VGEFGDKFRKAREKKNLSLDDVSKVTKIGTRMLQAIEEEHFDVLPGGVFNKGFIRAFAKHVGLDEQETINEYLESQRRAQADALAASDAQARALAAEEVQQKSATSNTRRAPAQRPAPGSASDSKAPKRQNSVSTSSATVEDLPELQLPRYDHVRPPRRLYAVRRGGPIPLRIVAALILVLILGLLLWQRHSRGAHAQGNAAPATQPAPPSLQPPAQPAAAAPAPAQVQLPTISKARVSPGTVVPAAGHPAATAKPASSNLAAGGELSTRTPPPAAESAPRQLELVIRASENSWISVTADGQVVSQETLIAPANAAVNARKQIVAKIGNAAGVTFVWNGQELPAQGGEAEVKTFVFDANGMHVQAPPNQGPAQNP
jgi:transcriptional regulator with XRE-family HTH domain